MLNSSIYLQSWNKLDSGSPIKAGKSMNMGSSDPFYSVLIKHQLNMIRAWSPTGGNSETGIDPLSFSKALLKLKSIMSSANTGETFSSSINSRRVMTRRELMEELNVSPVLAELMILFNLSSALEKESGSIPVSEFPPVGLQARIIFS